MNKKNMCVDCGKNPVTEPDLDTCEDCDYNNLIGEDDFDFVMQDVYNSAMWRQ